MKEAMLPVSDAIPRLRELASIRRQEALVADGIDRWELARDAAAIDAILAAYDQREAVYKDAVAFMDHLNAFNDVHNPNVHKALLALQQSVGASFHSIALGRETP